MNTFHKKEHLRNPWPPNQHCRQYSNESETESEVDAIKKLKGENASNRESS